MGFLAPWFLAGLAGVGVPVFVHLLRKQTTTPRPFSSLMFFERGTQSSTRHRRLRYLLLFALRMALLIILVLAFANPFVRRGSAGANGTLLVVVVDNSFSMRAGAAPGTRLEDAKREALAVLASRPGGQRAQVMALGEGMQVLTQPIQDGAALRAAVEGIEPTDAHGNFGELGRAVRALEETAHTPMELHLFSDMQRGDMPANFADMVLGPEVKLVLHQFPRGAATASPTPNWTVESVQAPADLADPKDRRVSHVRATIAGYNTPTAPRTVSLVVDGKTTATRTVNVPAGGRSTVDFEPLDVPYGFSRCEVRIDAADGFPADDAALFAVRRSDPEHVLFVHGAGDARSPLYFGAALNAAAASSFVQQVVNADQTTDVDPAKYAFVVLSDVGAVPSTFESALLRFVRGGGGVLIATGTSAGHGREVPVFGGSITAKRLSSNEGGFARVGSTDATFAVLQPPGTPGDKGETAPPADWSDAKFYFATGVEAKGARVVARLADGTPLLLDKQIGEGRVLLLTSGLDNVTNDLPLHPAFVPFVDQAARYLSGSDRLAGSRPVDSFVQLRAAGTSAAVAGGQTSGVEVIDPVGKRPLSLKEASTVQSFQLKRAGFYQIRYANGRNALIGVNPDRRESDLQSMPADVLQLWSGGGAPKPGSGAGAVGAVISAESAKKPYTLWWYVMLLALAAAVAERITASFFLGTQREEP